MEKPLVIAVCLKVQGSITVLMSHALIFTTSVRGDVATLLEKKSGISERLLHKRKKKKTTHIQLTKINLVLTQFQTENWVKEGWDFSFINILRELLYFLRYPFDSPCTVAFSEYSTTSNRIHAFMESTAQNGDFILSFTFQGLLDCLTGSCRNSQ